MRENLTLHFFFFGFSFAQPFHSCSQVDAQGFHAFSFFLTHDMKESRKGSKKKSSKVTSFRQ